MTTLVVVNKEQRQALRELLLGKGSVLVVTTEELAKKYGLEDGQDLDYEFGGEADVWLDLAYDEQHYFFADLRETER